MTRVLDAHDNDVLADYLDGMLDPVQTCAVERHLAICQHCCAFVREQRDVINRLRSFSLGSQGQHDLAAGLMNLAHEVQSECVPFRPHGPATLAVSAPAQYTSARRSVAFAVVAVAGCVGAALVAVQVPTGTSGGPTGQVHRDSTSVVRQLSQSSQVSEPAPGPVGFAAMVRSDHR